MEKFIPLSDQLIIGTDTKIYKFGYIHYALCSDRESRWAYFQSLDHNCEFCGNEWANPCYCILKIYYWTPFYPINIKKRFRSVTAQKKLKILKKYKYTCNKCGISPSLNNNIELQIDHIIPFHAGGSDDENNLQLLCKPCNGKRGKYA